MIQKKRIVYIIPIVVLSIIIIIVYFTFFYQKNSQTPYTALELGITELKSETDRDRDGIDDYTDIFESAKLYISSNPAYKSKYYEGGYPDDGSGVCTDVIWSALMGAGYDLKIMLDEDIANNMDAYTTIDTPDPNIDFRRVNNLKIFLERNAEVLTNSLEDPQEWQAGDIVVFREHIAICSDIRNEDGIPFLIHHDSRGAREANDIKNYTVVGHYRWILQ